MLSGFKQFILRGNVVDMAVGVVIGAAFAGVVKALSPSNALSARRRLGGWCLNALSARRHPTGPTRRLPQRPSAGSLTR